MGKGIGFNSRPGDEIAPEKIEKLFVTQALGARSGYLEALSAIPDEVIEMAAMIISRANMQLASKVREQIFFTLADHLTFAIERSRGSPFKIACCRKSGVFIRSSSASPARR
jgi:beta-glucoside operon transcriptional antiterminator